MIGRILNNESFFNYIFQTITMKGRSKGGGFCENKHLFDQAKLGSNGISNGSRKDKNNLSRNSLDKTNNLAVGVHVNGSRRELRIYLGWSAGEIDSQINQFAKAYRIKPRAVPFIKQAIIRQINNSAGNGSPCSAKFREAIAAKEFQCSLGQFLHDSYCVLGKTASRKRFDQISSSKLGRVPNQKSITKESKCSNCRCQSSEERFKLKQRVYSSISPSQNGSRALTDVSNHKAYQHNRRDVQGTQKGPVRLVINASTMRRSNLFSDSNSQWENSDGNTLKLAGGQFTLRQSNGEDCELFPSCQIQASSISSSLFFDKSRNSSDWAYPSSIAWSKGSSIKQESRINSYKLNRADTFAQLFNQKQLSAKQQHQLRQRKYHQQLEQQVVGYCRANVREITADEIDMEIVKNFQQLRAAPSPKHHILSKKNKSDQNSIPSSKGLMQFDNNNPLKLISSQIISQNRESGKKGIHQPTFQFDEPNTKDKQVLQRLRLLFNKLTRFNPANISCMSPNYIDYGQLSHDELWFMQLLLERLSHKDLQQMDQDKFCEFTRKYCPIQASKLQQPDDLGHLV